MVKSNTDVFSVLTQSQGRAQQAVDKGARLLQELTEIARDNAEALAVSSKAAAAGFESLGREAAAFGQKNFEDTTAAMKSLTTVSNPTELFQLQSEFVRAMFDSLLSQSNRIGDTLIELGGQIATPLADRYVAAVDRVKVATLQD
jgi:phasin family protein